MNSGITSIPGGGATEGDHFASIAVAFPAEATVIAKSFRAIGLNYLRRKKCLRDHELAAADGGYGQ